MREWSESRVQSSSEKAGKEEKRGEGDEGEDEEPG
jgi:hypothetical protein